ncbi:MAG: RNA-binding S4 domain-containing protein [Candidatus Sphingomonas colombiensis]|nr:RNA-binding S4 domain-containing protein [Sphingomonas sp.]WEK44339.1 MAG: RNA-binding S4 domain-containing protein [Sphingomonas sp.]
MADGVAPPAMRLDRFLWFARITKTRSAAQAMASDGHLRLDGRAVDRAAAPVRVGSILTLAQHGRIRALRVEALPLRRGPPAEARACYEELITDNRSQQAGND